MGPPVEVAPSIVTHTLTYMALSKHLVSRVLLKIGKGPLFLKGNIIFMSDMSSEQRGIKFRFSLKSFSSMYLRSINAKNSAGGE